MNETLGKDILAGKIGVIPTDTLYGLVGSALNKETVERIYEVRHRDQRKPCIVLISSTDDLKRFGIETTPVMRQILNDVWPGPVSVILPCTDNAFEYLHRGTDSLAFRFPNNKELLTLLRTTGPLIAPSANPEGMPPATTIATARDYFGDSVDFYVDGGVRNGTPSRLARIKGAELSFIR
jgi:L-threonylcarbamoyladenylate synthase